MAITSIQVNASLKVGAAMRRKTKDAVERVLSTGVRSREELRKLLAMETV